MFPVVHENVGKSGCIFFAHGSTLDLKKGFVVKLEIVAAKGDFKKGQNIRIWPATGRILGKSSFNGCNTFYNRDVGVKGFHIKGEENVRVPNVNVCKQAFKMEAIANE